MLVHGITPILNVSSVGDSMAWFEALGWKRGFSWNDAGMIADASAANEHGPAGFGSVCSGKTTIFLCCGAQGSRGTILPRFPGDDATDGVWMTWWMDSPANVDSMHATAIENGMMVTYPPTDEPWGIREFHLRHPDGHTFRVSAGLGKEESLSESGTTISDSRSVPMRSLAILVVVLFQPGFDGSRDGVQVVNQSAPKAGLEIRPTNRFRRHCEFSGKGGSRSGFHAD